MNASKIGIYYRLPANNWRLLMSRNGVITYLVIGGVLGFFIAIFISMSLSSRTRNRVPEIAGQPVPFTNIVIDFSKTYDIICQEYSSKERIYKNVTVLGYTGERVKENSGSFSSNYEYFSRWLALELPDKRRIYLPARKIEYLEESMNEKSN